jgi:hypothetical protein
MVKQISPEFHRALSEALKLSPFERMAMIEELAASFKDELATSSELPSEEDRPPFTAEELAELTKVEPLPPAEVVALGLLGTWADMGIEDGAEWVNQQKQKRRERRKWSKPS